MALRQLSLCGLCMCLLLAVALAGGGPSPPPQAGAVLGTVNCYKTVTSVPRWCGAEFTRALLPGNEGPPVSHYCCELLFCIREWTCDSLRNSVCTPPDGGYECPPTRSSLSPAAGRARAAVSTATTK